MRKRKREEKKKNEKKTKGSRRKESENKTRDELGKRRISRQLSTGREKKTFRARPKILRVNARREWFGMARWWPREMTRHHSGRNELQMTRYSCNPALVTW